MPLIDINREPFYTVESGAGAEALVMHGGPGLDHSYMRGLDALDDLLRLVYYDHRGDGRSTQEGLHRVTMDMYPDDAEQIRQALGLGQLVVLGHSHGASVGLELGLKYPASVTALILISGVGTYDYEMSPPQDVLALQDCISLEPSCSPPGVPAVFHQNSTVPETSQAPLGPSGTS